MGNLYGGVYRDRDVGIDFRSAGRRAIPNLWKHRDQSSRCPRKSTRSVGRRGNRAQSGLAHRTAPLPAVCYGGRCAAPSVPRPPVLPLIWCPSSAGMPNPSSRPPSTCHCRGPNRAPGADRCSGSHLGNGLPVHVMIVPVRGEGSVIVDATAAREPVALPVWKVTHRRLGGEWCCAGTMRSRATETKRDAEPCIAVELTWAVTGAASSGFIPACIIGGRSISRVANEGSDRATR